jgi:uncharacterized membrane protein YqiK
MLTFLAHRLVGPIAAGVALLLLVCVGVQAVKLHFAKAEIVKLGKQVERAERDLRTCQGNVSTLKASVAAQNAAVDALRREGEARVAESAKAVRSARAVAESARRDAARILAMKPASEDRCEAARRLIAEVG